MSGPLPIKISEIKHYCDLMRIRDPEDIHDLIYLLQELDGKWLKMWYDKNKKPESETQVDVRRTGR